MHGAATIPAGAQRTTYYVRKGINYIKDTAALEHLTPLTWA